MGAAKNARKARRKARRDSDRRSYIVSKRTMEAITTPGSKLGECIDPIASEASVVTGKDPYSKRAVERGYRLKLTRREVGAIQAEGHRVVREENAQSLEQGGYLHTKADLGSLFDRQHFLHKFANILPYLGPSSARTGARTATETSRAVMTNIDYSQIEQRIMAYMGGTDPGLKDRVSQLQRELSKQMDDQFFNSMYMHQPFAYQIDKKGTMMLDMETMPRDWPMRWPPSQRKAPPQCATYLAGKKVDMMILDDLIGDRDDQDVQEVGSVPADHS